MTSAILQAIDFVSDTRTEGGNAYTGLFSIQDVIDYMQNVHRQACSKEQVYTAIRFLRRHGHRIPYSSGLYQHDL